MHQRTILLTLLVSLSCAAVAAETETLTFDRPETAGICGFRALWDRPIVLAAGGVTAVRDQVVKDRAPTAPWDLKARKDGALPGA